MNSFEKATKDKVRFQTNKGALSVEDLWDLPLQSAKGISLNAMAKEFYKKVKEGAEIDFVEKVKPDPEMIAARLKLDIVKRVIEVRLEERDRVKKAKERRDMRDKLMAIKAKKQDAHLEDLSLEDLDKMLAEVSE
jgi:hypothetical protein